jgi:hypothetical protein
MINDLTGNKPATKWQLLATTRYTVDTQSLARESPQPGGTGDSPVSPGNLPGETIEAILSDET